MPRREDRSDKWRDRSTAFRESVYVVRPLNAGMALNVFNKKLNRGGVARFPLRSSDQPRLLFHLREYLCRCDDSRRRMRNGSGECKCVTLISGGGGTGSAFRVET